MTPIFSINIHMLTTKGLIDWDAIVSKLITANGSIRHIDQTIDETKTSAKAYSELIKNSLVPEQFARSPFFHMVKDWAEARYNFKNITFENYYPNLERYWPEFHFSKSIVESFQRYINLEVEECWISKVNPFTSVPFHKDEYDQEDTWVNKQNKKLSRYMVFIDKPHKNQLLIVGNTYYENTTQHTVIKWNSTKETHALINCSRIPHFLFHYLGFER